MRTLALLAALCPFAAGAVERPLKPPFAWERTLRFLGGAGSASGQVAFAGHGFDWALRPFDGAFVTGMSASIEGTRVSRERWYAFSTGVFVQLDLTYVCLSGLWSVEPPSNFPFRFLLGTRVGLDVTESWRVYPATPGDSSYLLLRPTLRSFGDLEVPLFEARRWHLFLRAALDTPVNMSTVFRWSFSAGFGWGYAE